MTRAELSALIAEHDVPHTFGQYALAQEAADACGADFDVDESGHLTPNARAAQTLALVVVEMARTIATMRSARVQDARDVEPMTLEMAVSDD